MDQQTQTSPKGYTMHSNNHGQGNGRTKLPNRPSAGKSLGFFGRSNYGKDGFMRDAATQTEAISFGLAKFSTTTTTNHIAQGTITTTRYEGRSQRCQLRTLAGVNFRLEDNTHEALTKKHFKLDESISTGLRLFSTNGNTYIYEYPFEENIDWSDKAWISKVNNWRYELLFRRYGGRNK